MPYNSELLPLPLWKPAAPPKFKAGMEQDAPFVATQYLQRSDLGMCVVSTTPPHFVAKIRPYRTCPEHKEGNEAHNQKQDLMAERNDQRRKEYFSNRLQADELGQIAQENGLTVKELLENHSQDYEPPLPSTYDEEFDEPRPIAKVPGLNVYLELYGCLDDIEPDEVDWDGPNGAYATLVRMSLWAQNIYDRDDRRKRASQSKDSQLLPEWVEEYDETMRPTMPPKCGIGIWPHIDPSRRPELLHDYTPSFSNADRAAMKKIKMERAAKAAKGLK